MNHSHNQLQAERIIITMSGDVALALVNMVAWTQEHNFDAQLVYCQSNEHNERMSDNLNDFTAELQEKIDPRQPE